MNSIIKNKTEYYDFFKFYRYYSYHAVSESEDTDPLCAFCDFVNNKTIRNQRRAYALFTKWWTGASKKNGSSVSDGDGNIQTTVSSLPYHPFQEFLTRPAEESIQNIFHEIMNYLLWKFEISFKGPRYVSNVNRSN